mmetsp:Transcript_88887/g.123398  ORF Transcript_88887/g.123398 Transcript_88887/m.123398 type:complete len:194 (+) Transcript_88887:52-633(+)
MSAKLLLVVASVLILSQARFGGIFKPLVTVPYVNISLYEGEWYEIVRAPAADLFEYGCQCNTAIYGLNSNGTVSVNNTCYRNSAWDIVIGYATPVDKTNARLKVKFPKAPFAGEYDIIALGKNYEYAMVGDPSRLFLWILSRTPTLDKTIYDELIAGAQKQGFKTTDLIHTVQGNDKCQNYHFGEEEEDVSEE